MPPRAVPELGVSDLPRNCIDLVGNVLPFFFLHTIKQNHFKNVKTKHLSNHLSDDNLAIMSNDWKKGNKAPN